MKKQEGLTLIDHSYLVSVAVKWLKKRLSLKFVHTRPDSPKSSMSPCRCQAKARKP